MKKIKKNGNIDETSQSNNTTNNTIRKMAIGNIDKKTSQGLQKNFSRKAKGASRLLKFAAPEVRTHKRELILAANDSSASEVEEQERVLAGLCMTTTVEESASPGTSEP